MRPGGATKTTELKERWPKCFANGSGSPGVGRAARQRIRLNREPFVLQPTTQACETESMAYHLNRPLVVVCAFGVLLGTGCASNPPPEAEPPPSEQVAAPAPPQEAPPQIPPEAFEACNGKSVGDACVTVLGDQATEGQCASAPVEANDSRLMCTAPQSHGPGRPPEGAGPGPGPGHEPPPEAVAACEGKNAGDSCTAEMRGRKLTGTCESPPPGARNRALSCRPSGPAGPRPEAGAQQTP
jgi:hypothetical protein